MASVTQNFGNSGLMGMGWNWWNFLDETLKRHILAWFHPFWAIDRANVITGFFL